MDQLAGLDDISYRAMMGEYILYCQGKVFGGIYDDRFLIKPTKSSLTMMPDAKKELPYEGTKEEFEAVQLEMESRSNIEVGKDGKIRIKIRKYSSKIN